MAKVLFPKKIPKDVFEWIRTRSGMSEEEFMGKFRKWNSWVNGELQPTFIQIVNLAKKTYTPFRYFYLDKPIKEKLSVHDFRKTNDIFKSPSTNLLDTLYDIEGRQRWLKEYLIENGYKSLDFIGSYNLDSDIKEVADSIRLKLDLNEDWAKSFGGLEAARRELIDRLEGIGICVFVNGMVGNNTHRALDVEEFRGFVIADALAPVMFINNKDAHTAQMFTIAHELAHLWINQSAIFNLDFRSIRGSDNKIEQFCDKVAAEFLVPRRELEKAWLAKEEDIKELIKKLSQKFKVSKVVIARRALDLEKIDKETFFEYYDEMQQRYRVKRDKKQEGGDFYNILKYRVSDRFYSLVYRAVQEGSLLHRDAFDLTNLKSKSFKRKATRLEDKIYNY